MYGWKNIEDVKLNFLNEIENDNVIEPIMYEILDPKRAVPINNRYYDRETIKTILINPNPRDPYERTSLEYLVEHREKIENTDLTMQRPTMLIIGIILIIILLTLTFIGLSMYSSYDEPGSWGSIFIMFGIILIIFFPAYAIFIILTMFIYFIVAAIFYYPKDK